MQSSDCGVRNKKLLNGCTPVPTLYQIGGNRENHEFRPFLRCQLRYTDIQPPITHHPPPTTNHMTWRSYLKTKTRQPAFLWRMVIWILAAGIGLGFVAQKIYPPQATEVKEKVASDDSWEILRSLAEQGEWGQLWWTLPRVVYHHKHLGPVVLSAITACCWLVFLWQAMRTPGLRELRLWCALIAIPLGVLSIWPTLFFDYWLEHAWNLRESKELIPGVRYFVLSVGLREELAKLLCLLPLMPLLLRINDELTTLLVSGCVGLGFAIEENINYFINSGGTSTLGRFLTANPLHITLTALAGLALYRALRNPKGWTSHSLGVFGMLVFAHGLYDAFIIVPALAEYSLFTMIIFALVIYQFFHELRALRPAQGDTISLSANFLCGVSVLTASTFVYLSATLGMSVAFDTLASGVTGLAVMVYLFLREMPETMVSV